MKTNPNQRSIWVRSGARYAVVPRDALISPALTVMEKLTLCGLCLFQNTNGMLWPLQKTLAEVAGCSTRSIKTSIKGLAQKGWIKRDYDRPRHRMVYEIRWESGADSTADSESEKQGNTASPAPQEQVNAASPGRGTPVHFVNTTGPLNRTSQDEQDQKALANARASEREGITSGELPQGETETQGQTPTAGPEVEQGDGFRTTKSPADADHAARLDRMQTTGKDAITKNRAAHDEKLRRAAERKVDVAAVFGKAALNGKKPSPEIEELGICYAAEFKALVGAAPPELSGKERGQLGNLVKRLGLKDACEIIQATFANWPKLSRQWGQAGVPKIGIILLRVEDVWAFVKSGGKSFGKTPTETRDEKERRLNEAREEAYKTGPAVGWK